MSKNLVIVESPAKARTISRMLSDDYIVKATLGHVRDLPEKELGVDIENGFNPTYVPIKGKNKVISEIKAAAKKASTLYLATDPDREGEAILWHVIEAAKLNKLPVKRIIFHEITKSAIEDAFKHPHRINTKLIDAQQARRILDRLVGYKISPLLWRKVRKGLSAGRVQSVAVRIIVERERLIEGFIPTEYWSIDAELTKKGVKNGFKAQLIGSNKAKKLIIANDKEARNIEKALSQASYVVSNVQRKPVARNPVAPFITSTLQQESWRKLRFNAKRTMSIAQTLYEGIAIDNGEPEGLITYMRTDSTHVATQAITETRKFIAQKYGPEFVPKSTRLYKKKVKGAQEAHEAIRPTSVKHEPMQIKSYLNDDQFKIYDLIWKRMVSSQMSSARFDSLTIDIDANTAEQKYLLRASNSTLAFPGFLTVYSEGRDEEENGDGKTPLPNLATKDTLDLLNLFKDQHFTKPPPRYTEASLIKTLEENGIGRPSTYAPIISTIQDREYVEKEKGHFIPKEMGLIVTDLLSAHFPEVFDISFTAKMEDQLDEIASGNRELLPTLQAFYTPFAEAIETAITKMPKVKPADQPTDEVCEKCGSPMVIKHGRFGKFMSCSKYPECKNAKPLPSDIKANCPECDSSLVERRTKKRRVFYGCSNYPNCKFASWEKPLSQPCPECQGLLLPVGTDNYKCAKCDHRGLTEEFQEEETALAAH